MADFKHFAVSLRNDDIFHLTCFGSPHPQWQKIGKAESLNKTKKNWHARIIRRTKYFNLLLIVMAPRYNEIFAVVISSFRYCMLIGQNEVFIFQSHSFVDLAVRYKEKTK